MGAPHADPLTRFWRHVDKTEDCWLWTGAKNDKGYGQLRIAGRAVYAHRFAFETLKEAIPAGLVIDHLCRTPNCVNPDHLEPVTHRENLRRGVWPPAKTHCKHGHEYTPENTYEWRDRRFCRTCGRQRSLAYWRKQADLRGRA